jgi:hypothetical protein
MGVGIYVSPLTLRPFQRTFSSSAFLMPYADPSGEFGWSDDEVLVATPSRNYTVRNYEQFFSDMNFPDGYTDSFSHSHTNTHTLSLSLIHSLVCNLVVEVEYVIVVLASNCLV